MLTFAAWFFGFRRELLRAQREGRPVGVLISDDFDGPCLCLSLVESVGWFSVTLGILNLEGEPAVTDIISWANIAAVRPRSPSVFVAQLPADMKAGIAVIEVHEAADYDED